MEIKTSAIGTAENNQQFQSIPFAPKGQHVVAASTCADVLTHKLWVIKVQEQRMTGRQGELGTDDHHVKLWSHDEHTYMEEKLAQLKELLKLRYNS